MNECANKMVSTDMNKKKMNGSLVSVPVSIFFNYPIKKQILQNPVWQVHNDNLWGISYINYSLWNDYLKYKN